MNTFLTAAAFIVLTLETPTGRRCSEVLLRAPLVSRAGPGDRPLGDEVTAEAITERARYLLIDEAVRGAARAIAEEVAAMPLPHDVARPLLGYL